HPYAMVLGTFDEPLDGYKGPTGCCIMSQEFYESDRSRGFVRGYSFEALRGFGPVSTALLGMGYGKVPSGEAHHDAFGALLDRTAGLLAICEDLPEPENRITLDPDLKDRDGIPAPRVRYRLSDNSTAMLEHGIARAKDALEAAGAREFIVEPLLRQAG